jgi:hypothetical protein
VFCQSFVYIQSSQVFARIYWIENEAKILRDQHWQGKTTFTGIVRVKYGEKLIYLVLKIIYLSLKSWKESVIVSKKKLLYLFGLILLRFTLRLQHGQRMVITLGFTIHNYVNVTLDVLKIMYSIVKPVTNTHPLPFWYWRIKKSSVHLVAYQTVLLPLPFPSPHISNIPI